MLVYWRVIGINAVFGAMKISARFALGVEPQKQFKVRRCHGNVTLIFQFPMLPDILATGSQRFQIYRELEDEGT